MKNYNKFIIELELSNEVDDLENEKDEIEQQYLLGKIVGKLDAYMRIYKDKEFNDSIEEKIKKFY